MFKVVKTEVIDHDKPKSEKTTTTEPAAPRIRDRN